MNKDLRFIKVMLVIITLLLLVQVIGPIWQPQAQAKNPPTIQDVNLVQISGREIGKYSTPYELHVALPVKIVD